LAADASGAAPNLGLAGTCWFAASVAAPPAGAAASSGQIASEPMKILRIVVKQVDAVMRQSMPPPGDTPSHAAARYIVRAAVADRVRQCD
jgi:hypothetical protein